MCFRVCILYKHTFLARFVRMRSHSEYFNYTSIYTPKACLLVLQCHLKNIVLSLYLHTSSHKYYVHLYSHSERFVTLSRRQKYSSAVVLLQYCSTHSHKKNHRRSEAFHHCLYSFIIKKGTKRC